MPEINAKFIAAIIVAALVIGGGFTFFHETYNAKPYVEIKFPGIFQNETKMFSFSTKGSSFSFTGNGTVNLYGTVRTGSGAPYDGFLYVYDFPRVDQVQVSNGSYSVILCHYGAYTIGYKASGYKTSFATFSILSGTGIQENVVIHKEGVYSVSGSTLNITNHSVANVNLTFISFFGTFQSSSNSFGSFSTSLQNGTYAVITEKRNYNVIPKPEFFNVSARNVSDLTLVMNHTKNSTFLATGLVYNDLKVPLGGVMINAYDTLTNKIIDTTYSSSTGQYTINISAGGTVLFYSKNGYIIAHSKVIVTSKNIENLDQNLTVVDPFIARGSTKISSGISFLPSFMITGVSTYLSTHNSIPYYEQYSSNGNVTLSLSNTFYHTMSTASKLMANFTVVVATELNGTYYYTSSTINSQGKATIPLDFGGNFNFAIYVPGFNWTKSAEIIPTTSSFLIIPDALTPLPGQYYRMSYNIISNGYQLLYPNVTMSENGLIVNQSFEKFRSGRFTFYYFADDRENYLINMEISVGESGFLNGTLDMLIQGEKAQNYSGNITLTPLPTIASQFTSPIGNVPGYDNARVMSTLNDTESSNLYTKGTGKITFILHSTKNVSGQKAVLYTMLYGKFYSKVVLINSSKFTVVMNFTTFFNFTLIGLYITAYNIHVKDSRNQTVNVYPTDRNLSTINITVVNEMSEKLNYDYGSTYGVSLNKSLPFSYMRIVNSPIQTLPNASSNDQYKLLLTYSLPKANYNFSYGGDGFLQSSLTVNMNSTLKSYEMNVTSYGILQLIHSPMKFTDNITLRTLSPLFIGTQYKYYVGNESAHDNYYRSVTGVNLSGVSEFTSIGMDDVFINSSVHLYSVNYPFLTQYINISNSEIHSYLTQTKYAGSTFRPVYDLYNNSLNSGVNNGIITNMSIMGYNGIQFKPFNMSKGSVGFMNSTEIFKTTSTTDNNTTRDFRITANTVYGLKIKLGTYQTDLSNSGLYMIDLGLMNVNFTNYGGKY